MASRELPQEVLIDIFALLPPKSVGRCRCLSKTWRSLLSTPQFIISQLKRNGQPRNLVLISSTGSIHTISIINKESWKLEIPGNWAIFGGSCDGLVLLVNDEEETFLVNPITLKQLKIPDSPLALNKKESFSMQGLGFDNSSHDYKIVKLSYYNTDNEYEPDVVDTFVDVYSVKRGFWRRAGASPYDHAVSDLSSGAFVNGALHWLASSWEPGYRSVIAAFSLSDEAFDEIPPPNDVDPEKFVFNKLVALGGCLCMIDTMGNNQTDIWIMKEYGLANSWIKLSIGAYCEREIINPVCCVGNDDIVLIIDEALVMYNRKEESITDMAVDGAPSVFIDGGAFIESLVTP